MSDINATLGNAGPLPTLEHKGRTYKVRYLGQNEKAAFVNWMKQEAQRAVLPLKKLVSPAEWASLWGDTVREVLTYKFHEDRTDAVYRTQAGLTAMASILFGCTVAEMETLLEERNDEVNALLADSYRLSEPQAEGGPEGNGPAAK